MDRRLGNLVRYETGPQAVPIFLDVNTLAGEHLVILAMTGQGKVRHGGADH